MPRKKAKVVKGRRPKGSGSSFPDKRRGGWAGKVPVGKHPQTGKTVYQYFHADTQREVEERMRTAKPVAAESVTLGEWCDRWFAASKVGSNSKRVYKARIEKRIRPSLGEFKLTDLTAWDIEEASGTWAGNPNTIRDTISTLSTILQAARRKKLVSENVAELAVRPAASKTKFDLFARDELKLILGAALSQPTWHTFAVLVLTGARIGEAIALRPTDFNQATGELLIQRTWTRDGEGPPKSENSLRTIEAHPTLHPLLIAGTPVCHYTTAAGRWRSLLKSIDLRPRSLHQTRHSFASYALADGTPVADLAAFLGHTPQELLRTYAHVTKADMRAVAGRVLGL